MKLYTHASPSHERMLNEFLLPSATEFDAVVVGRCAQQSPDQFGLPKWGRNTYQKALTMQRAVHECEEYVVWADADVMFLAPAIEAMMSYLESYDIVFQQDSRMSCTGLWLARCNLRVRGIFDRMVAMKSYFEQPRCDDQTAMHRLLRQTDVAAGFLPPNEFYTMGYQQGIWREWVPCEGQLPHLPSTARVFHANWCRGVAEKELLLGQIRDQHSGASGIVNSETEVSNRTA
ncbi:MAG: putative nucleotide-diphospho-sugar transferase [Pirellulaceae bacterium]